MTTDLDKLRLQCARWLRNHVSDIDWGEGSPFDPKKITRKSKWQMSGATKLRYTNADRKREGKPPVKEVYVDVLNNDKPFKGWITLPLMKIRAHLEREMTVYYGSRRPLDQALLLLDFDWHDDLKAEYGEDSDAQAAAQYVRDALFPSAKMYIEPSTGGLGAHAYLLVDCADVSSKRLNDLLVHLCSVIQILIANEGFKCKFCDFYGNFTVFEKKWHIPDRGISRLAKLPRPQTAQQMREVIALEPVSFGYLSILEEIDFLRFRLGESLPDAVWEPQTAEHGMRTPNELPLNGAPPVAATTHYQQDLQQQSVYCGHICPQKLLEQDRIEALKQRTNPNERMFHAVYFLARKIQRCPTVDEALTFYESNGLNTGEDIKERRRERAEDAVQSCQATFVAASRRGALRYLLTVQQRVSEADLKKSGYYRKISHEDVALALYVLTERLRRPQADPEYQHTVGQKFMIKAFRTLKRCGISKRSLNGRKWSAIKGLLEKAGLIRRIADYAPGIAAQFELGPSHPLAKRDERRAA